MHIPIEVIKEVGKYLTAADKGECMRVCYDWYKPFLELQYTKVYIRTRHQFKLFYRTIQSSSEINNPLGNHVESLKLGSRVGLTRDEFESLPVLFQQLQLLEFDPQLWRYMRPSEQLMRFDHMRHLPTFNKLNLFQPLFDISNRSWTDQLTYLSIDGTILEYLLNNQLILSIWSRLSKLEELVLQGNNYTQLNVKVIMALGAQLPRLKNLTLSCVTLPLEESDLCSTTTIPLFSSAVSLRLDDVHIKTWRVITFLSLAFYHIQSLDLDMTFDWFYNDNVTIELYEQSMDACMGLAQMCIFLKKIKFRRVNTSVFPFPYDTFFQEIEDIHLDKVLIEMTQSAWWSTIDPAASFRAVTTQTGLLYKCSLKWSWTGKKTEAGLLKNLSCCPNLTELELDCDIPLKHGFRVDALLDHCPQLQSLSLANAMVTTHRNIEKATEKRYRLKALTLKESVLGDHLMDYLAQSCLGLERLTIAHCVQEKPRRSLFFVIRMPEHQFEFIKLDSIYLNPGGSEQRSQVDMAILSFYESTRYTHQIDRRKRTKINEEDGPMPEMWRFYHVHSSKQAVRKQLKRLSTDEAARIANFQMNDKKWKLVKNASKRKQYTERNLWEKDIQFGAVLLLAKSVDTLEFNELKV
ncbi:hypothetical protein EDC96DRAFT_520404 [Choanephora cucurbitarum]|nr:hypothetical protein EDC96DRAFT_520404 [Choanephora cucurbitarum]